MVELLNIYQTIKLFQFYFINLYDCVATKIYLNCEEKSNECKPANNIKVKEMLMSTYYDTDKVKYRDEIIDIGVEIYNILNTSNQESS